MPLGKYVLVPAALRALVAGRCFGELTDKEILPCFVRGNLRDDTWKILWREGNLQNMSRLNDLLQQAGNIGRNGR